MSIITQENICPRCQTREKFLETFKKCFYCSKKHCYQCWNELQLSDDYKLLLDLLPNIDHANQRRICSNCMKSILEQTFQNSPVKKQRIVQNNDQEYQLAIAMSLSQKEADEKRKFKEKKPSSNPKIAIEENNLLEKTGQTIERFMNRAKSNYQRNRDVIGDTALLSAFISLQTCANDLEQFKNDLDHQRQHFETLQEKLTALRDAREALNILRYEHQQKKRQEQERHRLNMLQKVADLRQIKHNQIANYQEKYFQRLLEEEQLIKQKLAKE